LAPRRTSTRRIRTDGRRYIRGVGRAHGRDEATGGRQGGRRSRPRLLYIGKVLTEGATFNGESGYTENCNFKYTTGGIKGIDHLQLIAIGGDGEVCKVT
jgi:hypothetical protein